MSATTGRARGVMSKVKGPEVYSVPCACRDSTVPDDQTRPGVLGAPRKGDLTPLTPCVQRARGATRLHDDTASTSVARKQEARHEGRMIKCGSSTPTKPRRRRRRSIKENISREGASERQQPQAAKHFFELGVYLFLAGREELGCHSSAISKNYA